MEKTAYGLLEPCEFPDTLVILGTDASGKNHVANLIAQLAVDFGYKIEKREGWFSRKASNAMSSEDKGRFDLLAERLFISTFPLTRFLLPLLLGFLIKADLRMFRRNEGKIMIISHTGLRVLAFYLGNIFKNVEEIKLPGYLDNALRSIIPATGAKTMVLDIDDSIRKARIAKRLKSGKMDYFDQYMLKNSERSEKIENILVWLGKVYLGAKTIYNNDPDNAKLTTEITNFFADKKYGGIENFELSEHHTNLVLS